ncbi:MULTISPECIES: hypothetical protein [unclassified Crossiella]|uniref:hypothetical protein n=1 Tax=unclassified Crossiella TaxID=2620835 RepID=UPI001FFF7475|nr:MULTISPECIES: hypothetical protein [unclassified Crossiella]MCK2244484.1 hypothetical protein [Crossiella sp. S99.2]MCK2258115.1 hypothetical protein [Crossiella sp. S99.1]
MNSTDNPATLWIHTGDWWVRADQVAAIGIAEVFHIGGRYSVRIHLAGVPGDGEFHELHRCADQDQARACAAAVAERLTGWRHGYGTLQVNSAGEVVTVRPVPELLDSG